MNIWRKKIYFLGEEKEEEQIFEERKYIFLHDGTGSVCVSTGWYLVVLGQYNLALLGIKWYLVDMGFYACIY